MKTSCGECGQPHPGCNQHPRVRTLEEEIAIAARFNRPPKEPKTLRPCMRPPKTGSPLCFMHGGEAKQVKNATKQRKADHQAREQLAQLMRVMPDVKPVTNPLVALQMLAGRVLAWSDLLEAKVADLGDWRYEDLKGSEQLRSEVGLLERAMSECRQVLTALAKVNIDERLAAIDEAIGHQVADLLAASLHELDLGDAIEAQARAVVRRRLGELGG